MKFARQIFLKQRSETVSYRCDDNVCRFVQPSRLERNVDLSGVACKARALNGFITDPAIVSNNRPAGGPMNKASRAGTGRTTDDRKSNVCSSVYADDGYRYSSALLTIVDIVCTKGVDFLTTNSGLTRRPRHECR